MPMRRASRSRTGKRPKEYLLKYETQNDSDIESSRTMTFVVMWRLAGSSIHPFSSASTMSFIETMPRRRSPSAMGIPVIRFFFIVAWMRLRVSAGPAVRIGCVITSLTLRR